jgi:hypothetical protein
VVDHHRDIVESFGDAIEHRPVFGVDEVENLARAREVDPARARIP